MVLEHVLFFKAGQGLVSAAIASVLLLWCLAVKSKHAHVPILLLLQLLVVSLWSSAVCFCYDIRTVFDVPYIRIRIFELI